MILVSFDHFASYHFNVWLRSCKQHKTQAAEISVCFLFQEAGDAPATQEKPVCSSQQQGKS